MYKNKHIHTYICIVENLYLYNNSRLDSGSATRPMSDMCLLMPVQLAKCHLINKVKAHNGSRLLPGSSTNMILSSYVVHKASKASLWNSCCDLYPNTPN